MTTATQHDPASGPQPPPQAPSRRLFRRPDVGILGGVSVGLGEYFNVDPVLIRIGFVLLTVSGGLGLPLYAILWLVVPRADGPPPATSAARPQRADRTAASSPQFWVGVGLTALGAVALANAFDGPGNVLAALVLIGIGVALFTMDGRGAAPTLAPFAATPDEVTGTHDAPADAPPTPTWAAAVPAPVHTPAPPRERSVLGRVTMAALVFWAGLALLLDSLAGVEVTALTATAVGVMILGAGLLVGAWLGRARWLVLIGILLLPMLAFAAMLDAFDLPLRGSVGDSTVALVGDNLDHHHLAGQLVVELDRSRPVEGQTAAANVSLTFGEMIIDIPADVRVELTLRATAGEVQVVGGDNRAGTSVRSTLVYNDDAPGGTIVVDARVGFGSIRVRGPGDLASQIDTTSTVGGRP